MLDELLAEISSQGWLFNNCYQIDTDLWRVNLRREVEDGAYYTDWAEAPTFAEALEDCMSKLAQAEWSPVKSQAFTTEPTKPKTNLLQALGLIKPIERRM